MLERPIVDKFVSDWCVKAAHSNQKFETLLEVGELAYKHAIRWLCELAYIGPTTMAKAWIYALRQCLATSLITD